MNNGASFSVASGATLNLNDLPPVKGSAGGVDFLVGDGKAGEYLNNAGTVTWTGTNILAGPNANSINDFMEVPVLNTGTFNANGMGDGAVTLGATLDISGTDAKTNNVSFYQTGGALNLNSNATVLVEDSYYQSGGQLTSDASPCILQSGSLNPLDINIAGGKVIVDTVANSVSTLTFVAATVEFNGELDVDGLTQNGGGSTRCDQLICKGAAVTLGTSSFLDVSQTGSAPLGTGNRWTVMTYSSITGPVPQKWAVISYPMGMSVSTGPNDVLVSN